MPIDFGRFRVSQTTRPSHPRQIFAGLSRGPGFGYLRDVQGQVLDKWHERRAERDLVIKMNTGTGKTVVGLLALLSSMREGLGPALYVTPDKFLTAQAGSQADDLGIPWTDDPKSTAYLSGETICIVNIYRLVNGLSVFGGPGSTRVNPLPIGSLVVDDAHACVSTIEEKTTVCIKHDHPLYTDILDLFESALLQQSSAQLMDLKDRVPGVIIRVPIAAWGQNSVTVIQMIHSFQHEEPIKFSWPFIRDILPSCQAVFSEDSLEIQPLCPPTNMVTSFQETKRRLYLTATLPDDSVLITHFGASESSALSPVTPSNAADIGDRLILSPLELNPTATELVIRQTIRSLANQHNVVVLVPSYHRSKVWEELADQIVNAEGIAAAVESLKDDHVGLVVFVNKYDGVDLPDEACRILVIDGVPEATRNAKRREAAILGGSDVLAYRRLQRIEQGMGRGVRSTEDYCVVLLLGISLSSTLARPNIRDRLSPATRAQLELSMAIAREIEHRGIQELIGVAKQCLDRDPGWLQVSRQCLEGVNYSGGSIEPFATPVRRAFDASTIGQYGAACSAMSEAVNSATDDKTKGWLQEQLATYMYPVDPPRAQRALAGAVKLNRRVMRPITGISYEPAPSGIDQARMAWRELDRRFIGSSELVLGIRAVLDELVFGGPARAFEDGIEELGRILGFVSQCPERDSDGGPDNLWSLGEMKFLVIECKNEGTAQVAKKDAAQLGHSMNWFRDQYDSTCKAIPVLIHHSGDHREGAVSPADTRILDSDRMRRLHESLTQFATTLAARWPLESSDLREVLHEQGLMATTIVDRYTKRLG